MPRSVWHLAFGLGICHHMVNFGQWIWMSVSRKESNVINRTMSMKAARKPIQADESSAFPYTHMKTKHEDQNLWASLSYLLDFFLRTPPMRLGVGFGEDLGEPWREEEAFLDLVTLGSGVGSRSSTTITSSRPLIVLEFPMRAPASASSLVSSSSCSSFSSSLDTSSSSDVKCRDWRRGALAPPRVVGS